MKKSLLRLEDIQPGGSYGTEDSLIKLKAIGDYLKSEKVPFQMSVIPRSVHPEINYDKSIADMQDSYVQLFNNTIKYLQKIDGATIGMHGYTHQFGNSGSAQGFEFYEKSLNSDVPPQDNPKACYEKEAFVNSYAYSRMKEGYETFKKAGIKVDWGFSTPHYAAHWPQRDIIEAWTGLLYEPDYSSKNKGNRNIIIKDTDSPFYRGVIYVPTLLDYVQGQDPQAHVKRICNELNGYTENDLASFFYHPYLEFTFIHITDTGVVYDENSYLKQLIRKFKEKLFTFVPILSLMDFVPSAKVADIFPGINTRVFISDINGDGESEFIGWNTDTGSWKYTKLNVEKFPDRLFKESKAVYSLGLDNWVAGKNWIPLFGDFNGDGKQDLLVWNPNKLTLKVALSDGAQFNPSKKFSDFRWLKTLNINKDCIPLIGDFNGDGKDDLLIWNPLKREGYVAISNGSKFVIDLSKTDYLWLKTLSINSDCIPLVGDFNGDGKTDILVWEPVSGKWKVALSNGTQFTSDEVQEESTWLIQWGVGNHWKPLIGDFNGDGMDDILVVNPLRGDWQVALSSGTRFNTTNNAFKYWAAGPNMQPFVADINGDGKASLIARNPKEGAIYCAVSVL